MHISFINTRVRILSFPKETLPLWTHDIMRLMYTPASSKSTVKPEPFLCITENSVEYCVIASVAAFEKGFSCPRQVRFPNTSGRYYSLTHDVYYVVQVESEDEQEYQSRTILEMSAAFARAKIAIMYISTYQTDILLVKECDLRDAVCLWFEADYHVSGLNLVEPWKYTPLNTKTPAFTSEAPSPSAAPVPEVEPEAVEPPAAGLAFGPAATEHPGIDSDDVVVSGKPESVVDLPSGPLVPAQLRIMDFRVRQVGLPISHKPEWLPLLFHILFFPEMLGLARSTDRFISFVAANHEVSFVGPQNVIEVLRRTGIDASPQPRYYRLFQILYRKNLKRSGLVYDMSEEMNKANIELMYVTTYHTACIMVDEENFGVTQNILHSHQHFSSTSEGNDDSNDSEADSALG
ncbi:hypothetical protein H4R34_002913 [Dimargaris verticillata]|uniref:CASTOR ACT domain-containing protein n=1 Tax=Dimargaris verticillata TaxID=2761393 RepID=A0A9W8B333_9FUNG|nr:hypothetical protein H4R34_002913 [Dimargaris verticillata]